MRKRLLLVLGAFLAASAVAAPLPYDESADAKAEVQRALTAAKRSQVPVFVIFGANWCEDCRVLDRAIQSGKSAELLAREFKVVKVDIGNFDRNLDIVAAYGNPIKKGIPAAVILSPQRGPLRHPRRRVRRCPAHERKRHLRLPQEGHANGESEGEAVALPNEAEQLHSFTMPIQNISLPPVSMSYLRT